MSCSLVKVGLCLPRAQARLLETPHRSKPRLVVSGPASQGEREEELPEVLIGVARLRKLDVLLADPLEAIESFEEVITDLIGGRV